MKIGHHVFTACVLLLLARVNAVAGDGLWAHYRMDETTGLVIHDSSGNQHDAAAAGSLFMSVAGFNGRAQLSTGWGPYYGSDITVNCPAFPAFSWCAWIRVTDIAKGTRAGSLLPIIYFTAGADDSQASRLLGLLGNRLVFRIFQQDGTYRQVRAKRMIHVMQWLHVAGVAHENGTMRLYVNGKPQGAPVALGGMATGCDLLRFGRRISTGYRTPVEIDEVRIYERELDAAEIADMAHVDPRVVTWDGGGADTKWSTPENWTGDTVPRTIDTVVFDATSGKDCAIDYANVGYYRQVANSWLLGMQGLRIKAGYNGTLRMQTYYDYTPVTLRIGKGGFSQAGGHFLGNEYSVFIAGDFILTGGSFTAPGGRLEIQGQFSDTCSGFGHNNGTTVLHATDHALVCTSPFARLYLCGRADRGLSMNVQFEEGGGHESTGVSRDLSGYGNNVSGTGFAWRNTCPATTKPRSRYSLWVSKQFEAPNFSNIDDDFTVACWFRTRIADDKDRVLIGKPGVFSLSMNDDASGRLRAALGSETIMGVTPITDGAWHHAVLMRGNETFALYLDGALEAQATFTGSTPVDRNDPWVGTRILIGKWHTNIPDDPNLDHNEAFVGFMDDIRIYARALSLNEIQALAAGNEDAGCFTLGSELVVQGDLYIVDTTLDVSASGYGIMLGGGWYNFAGRSGFTPRDAAVSLHTDRTDNMILCSGSPFHDLRFSSPSGSGKWTMLDPLLVGDTLTQTSGILDNNGSMSGETVYRQGFPVVTSAIEQTGGSMNLNDCALVMTGSPDGAVMHLAAPVRSLLLGTPDSADLLLHYPLVSGMRRALHDFSAWHTPPFVSGADPDFAWTGQVADNLCAFSSAALDCSGSAHGGISVNSMNAKGEHILNLDEFTLSLWYRASISSAEQVIAWQTDNGIDCTRFEVVLKADGTTRFRYFDQVLTSQRATTDNAWHHLAVLCNGSRIRLYIDSYPEAEAPYTACAALPMVNIEFGPRAKYHGCLDEIRYYGRGLSDDEINRLASGLDALTPASGNTVVLDQDLTVDRSVMITAVRLEAAGAPTLNVGGNWRNRLGSNGFSPGSSTVTFTGNAACVYGSTTFNNLTRQVTDADELRFETNNRQIIAGTWRMHGADSNLLTLTGTMPNGHWDIAPQGTRDLQYLAVSGSNNLDPLPVDVRDSNCVNNNGNVNWLFGSGNYFVNPPGSRTSPAWVELYFPVPPESLSATMDGQAVQGTQFSTGRWSLGPAGEAPQGIPLQPDSPVQVRVHFTLGTEQTIDQTVQWVPTRIGDPGLPDFSLRRGAGLLLTAGDVGSGTNIEIDANGDGVYELAGAPGDRFPVVFPVAGEITVSARIDGADAGTLLVKVVDNASMPPKAYIMANQWSSAFQATAPVPASASSDLVLCSADPVIIEVKSLTDRSYSFRGNRAGESAVLLRLRDNAGPVMAQQPVTVPEKLELTNLVELPVVQRFADNKPLVAGCVRIKPYIPGLVIRVQIYAGGATFEDGTRVLDLPTDSFDPFGQRNYYLIAPVNGYARCCHGVGLKP